MIVQLTEQNLPLVCAELAARDPDLAMILTAHGPPPLWARAPGFATLVHIILEQQVSLASAKAAFDRLAAAGPITPEQLLTYNDDQLRACYVSRQKASYLRGLAAAILAGSLDLAGLAALEDDAVRTELVRLKGIGRWTADIYLLMALGRADIWPTGDLAIVVAAQRTKRLAVRPSAEALEALAVPWRPYRAAAARMLWHFYLSAPVRASVQPKK